MSKAFTRESDDAPEAPIRSSNPTPLPLGFKNYLTPQGARELRQTLEQLSEQERPRLAELIEDPEAKRQLRLLNVRIAQLENSLRTAVVVPRPNSEDGEVHFGATVTVRQEDGEIMQYRIVGIDEAKLECNWISWTSPVSKALLNSRIGAKVRCQTPSGDEELEILEIRYE
jgi:transcription elongation factor GreB